MIIASSNTMVALDSATTRRASVIAARTKDTVMGIIKAEMINTLKAKMQNGVAHFIFMKKNGQLREAWGTTAHSLMKAKINGNGYDRDSVKCVAFFDVERGEFRSLRFENLVKVF